MGAMLAGMATGVFAVGFAVVIHIIYLVIIYTDAKRNGLQALNWLVVGLVLNLWSLPVYIAVRIKAAKLRCDLCGAKYSANKSVCPYCGKAVKVFDDSKIAEKLVIGTIAVVGTAFVVLFVLSLII